MAKSKYAWFTRITAAAVGLLLTGLLSTGVAARKPYIEGPIIQNLLTRTPNEQRCSGLGVFGYNRAIDRDNSVSEQKVRLDVKEVWAWNRSPVQTRTSHDNIIQAVYADTAHKWTPAQWRQHIENTCLAYLHRLGLR